MLDEAAATVYDAAFEQQDESAELDSGGKPSFGRLTEAVTND